ncbi:MAG: hypothetical protein ACTTJ6_01805 [Treponema sp.]
MLKVTIEGDERLEIKEPKYINVSLENPKVWGDVKKQVEELCVLKPEWSKKDYGIYDYRLNKWAGREIDASTPITKDITVVVRTNYVNFEWDGTILKKYNGEKPKGTIIIPTKAAEALCLAFCENVTAVSLAGCKSLTKLDLSYTSIVNIDLTPCKKLHWLNLEKIPIRRIDLSSCKKLVCLYLVYTSIRNIDLSLCANLNNFSLVGTDVINIDLSESKSLQSLDLGGGVINGLDLSACINLRTLFLTEISITTFGQLSTARLDLSACKKLRSLYLRETNIASINLSSCKKLKKMFLERILNLIAKEC